MDLTGGVEESAMTEIDYYRRRIEEELAAAERAEDPDIAQLHRDMAEQYRQHMQMELDDSQGPSNLSRDPA